MPHASAAAQRRAILIAVFFTALAQGVAVPVLPELQQAFSVSVSQVVLVTSVWGVARLVADLPLGIVVDRVGTGRMLLAGCALSVGGNALAAFAPSFGVLLLGRVVSGLGASFISFTAIISLIALSPTGRRGRTLGVYQAVLQGSSSIGPLLAGLAAAIAGWPAAFLVAGVGGALATASLLVSRYLTVRSAAPPTERPSPAPAPVDPGPPTLRDRTFPWAVHASTFALFLVTGAIVQSTIPLFGGSELGLDAAAIGLVLGTATAIRFVVGLVGAELSDRVGRLAVLSFGMLTMIAALLIFQFVDGFVGFLLVTWMLGAGRLGNSVPIVMLSDHLEGRPMGRVVGMNRFVGDLAIVVGPIMAGLLIDRLGYGAAFTSVAAVVAASTIALIVVGRGAKPKPATTAGRGDDAGAAGLAQTDE